MIYLRFSTIGETERVKTNGSQSLHWPLVVRVLYLLNKCDYSRSVGLVCRRLFFNSSQAKLAFTILTKGEKLVSCAFNPCYSGMKYQHSKRTPYTSGLCVKSCNQGGVISPFKQMSDNFRVKGIYLKGFSLEMADCGSARASYFRGRTIDEPSLIVLLRPRVFKS